MFQIESQELKGSRLVRYGRGRKAISWILNEIKPHSHIVFVDKKYALCGKMFEYIFEPILKERSRIFYAINFHKFIATSVYMHSKVDDCYTNNMLREFTDMMKTMDSSKLDSVR